MQTNESTKLMNERFGITPEFQAKVVADAQILAAGGTVEDIPAFLADAAKLSDHVRLLFAALGRQAHIEASKLLAEGEDPGMIRSKLLEEALTDHPDQPFDSPFLKTIHEGIDDALAGKPLGG
jgi:hypothetical protein